MPYLEVINHWFSEIYPHMFYFSLGDDTRHKQKLNQLAQLILALGKTIGPRRLAAPLSTF